MPTFIKTDVIAAGATALPLQGSLYEFMQFNAKLDISLVQQSGAIGGVVATVNSGPDTLMEESPISFAARFPIEPDDYFLHDLAAASDRLKIQLRNTSGGPLTVVTALQITPL